MSARLRKCLPGVVCAGVLAVTALSLWGQEAGGKKYALLVGVKAYDHSSFENLNYTENDVTALAEVLRGRGYRVTLLCDTEGKKDPRFAPTRANIVKHLDEVTGRCKRSDTVLLAFAGHGLQYKEEKSSHFCPSDARPNDPKTLVSLGEVYRQLDESGAGAKLVLVDACRVAPRARGRGLDGENAPHPPKGTAIMFACSPGQSAYESNELRHGIFFYYVLEGLRGGAKNARGEVTWNSLTEHVQHHVALEAPKRFGTDQDPNVVANLAGAPSILVAATFSGGTGNTTSVLPPVTGNTEAAMPKEVVNSIGMKLMRLPAGTFRMGSPPNEEDRDPRGDGSETQHAVEITRPFYMGAYEVTQEQYQRVTGSNPSSFSAQGDVKERAAGLNTRNFPVEMVSWDDAVAFCRQLAALPAEKAAGRVYVLPTEAEWEYACRGGAAAYQVFHFGNSLSSRQANFDGRYRYGSAAKGPYLARPVAVDAPGYEPNGFGLYHLHGNVWEWCADWYDQDYYRNSDSRDPSGPNSGVARVLRGGSWLNYGRECRAAYRAMSAPGDRSHAYGFRVVWRPGVSTP